MNKTTISIAVICAFFLSFSSVNASFSTTSDNLPSRPTTNQCVVKVRAHYDGNTGTVYDTLYYYNKDTLPLNVLSVSSGFINLTETNGEMDNTLYWNPSTNAWVVHNNTSYTSGWDQATVRLLGPVYADFLSTCDLYYSNNYINHTKCNFHLYDKNITYIES